MNFIMEIWQFAKARKKMWMLPLFFLATLFGMLFILSQGSVIAPFIYTLF
jgi:hypothetical protein